MGFIFFLFRMHARSGVLFAYLFGSNLWILFLQCGSGRSVAPIKAGFQARVGRRNAGT